MAHSWYMWARLVMRMVTRKVTRKVKQKVKEGNVCLARGLVHHRLVVVVLLLLINFYNSIMAREHGILPST